MKLVFITNYYNHHTGPLSDAWYDLLGSEYLQVCTEPVEDERLKLGWASNNAAGKPYLAFAYESPAKARELKEEADAAEIVIYGGMDRSWIAPRISRGKLTFRYTERLFKKGFWRIVHPKYLNDLRKNHISLQAPHFHLLCAGNYAAEDMRRLGLYRSRMWKWGYFPQLTAETERAAPAGDEILRILWCGRMIAWKQTDHLIEAVSRLFRMGYSVRLDLVGDGQERGALEHLTRRLLPEGTAVFHGAMPPDAVRLWMQRTDIVAVTSSFEEGWGAVVNEAMSAGCCVVCGSGVGSASYLIEHGVNGWIYRNGRVSELTEVLKTLARDRNLVRKTGEQAARTIEQWSPVIAAERFLHLAAVLASGDSAQPLFSSGPCSPAFAHPRRDPPAGSC